MSVNPGVVETQSSRAWMDVRKGWAWQGAKVPVDISLGSGELVMVVGSTQLDKREREALVRLSGDAVLSTLIASREQPEIRVGLADAAFRYPSVFGLGRTTIVVRQDGRPDFALSFVDPAQTGNPLTSPRRFTFRLLRAGPAARRVRDSWKEAVEACR
ncbi:MAG: hypothetical protein WD844_15415 [Thermoleophilaceae bacterium]